MKRRWIRRLTLSVAGVAALLGIAVIALYWNTARVREVPPGPELAALPAGDATRVEYLVHVLGCNGSHGHDIGGAMFAHIPPAAHLVAPNLTEVRERYGDQY